MRRIRITVSYDGTNYHGWQVQPGLLTIQSELERVLTKIEGRAVKVAGSGRTDAGVHALAQVAAFDFSNPIPVENLRKAINRLLEPDIRILEVSEVSPDFHPRFNARAKTYEYRIWREEICPPFERLYVCLHPYPLDEESMTSAAALYEGEHDFTTFAAADGKDGLGRSKVRVIYSSTLKRTGPHLIFRVRGSGFLKHMVRNMVGVLLEVGKSNLTLDDVTARLRPNNEIPAGPSTPSRGLFLISVEY